jgi:uncharacterized protein YbjT (DUF2867 family)
VDVVVAGGHGKIAQHLLRMLAERGDRAHGLIRNPDHAKDLEALGAEAVICDMEAETDLAPFVGEADAVVFAAGAGPGSGPERKRTVDYEGAVKLIDAAKARGIDRYLIVSSIGAGNPEDASEQMSAYQQAKHDADVAVAESGLRYTIVRPGRLTDDPGTGRVRIAERLELAEIPRDDVAALLFTVLDENLAIGKTFALVSGDDGIEAALTRLG